MLTNWEFRAFLCILFISVVSYRAAELKQLLINHFLIDYLLDVDVITLFHNGPVWNSLILENVKVNPASVTSTKLALPGIPAGKWAGLDWAKKNERARPGLKIKFLKQWRGWDMLSWVIEAWTYRVIQKSYARFIFAITCVNVHWF